MDSHDQYKKWLAWFIGLVTLSYQFTVPLLSRNRPTFYLDDFYVSSLNKSLHSTTTTTTTTIYFDLRIQNENSIIGLYYDDPLKLTFTYFPPTITTNTNFTIGDHSIQGFYQGNGKVKHVQDFAVVQDAFSPADHRRQLGETFVSLMGPAKVVVLRVDLDARVKFKSIENKKSHLVAGAVVEVNGNTGNNVLKKTIQLEYASGSNKWGVVQWLLFFPLISLFVIIGFVVFPMISICLATVASRF